MNVPCRNIRADPQPSTLAPPELPATVGIALTLRWRDGRRPLPRLQPPLLENKLDAELNIPRLTQTIERSEIARRPCCGIRVAQLVKLVASERRDVVGVRRRRPELFW